MQHLACEGTQYKTEGTLSVLPGSLQECHEMVTAFEVSALQSRFYIDSFPKLARCFIDSFIATLHVRDSNGVWLNHYSASQ